ncbi:MAG: hypothetical protein QXD23_02495 [Candidatus Micrarchaeaceae archaeon]
MPENKTEDIKTKKVEKESKLQQQQKTPENKVNTQNNFDGYLCEIVDVVKGRTGIYGEIKQAMCRILEGKDKGRVIRRNFTGKIQKGDISRLPDTSREDKRIIAR